MRSLLSKSAVGGIICFALLLCGVSALAQSDQITARISLDKQTYRVGKEIPVKVEIINNGIKGLIVSNVVTTAVTDRQGYVKFTVTDSKGARQSPQLNLFADTFAAFPSEPDWRRVLGNWLVLFPKDSFSSQISLDGATFPFLMKPGRYKISAVYSSAGLDYGANYGKLGLKAKDVASLPFRPWSGTIQTNFVWVTIVPGPKSGDR